MFALFALLQAPLDAFLATMGLALPLAQLVCQKYAKRL